MRGGRQSTVCSGPMCALAGALALIMLSGPAQGAITQQPLGTLGQQLAQPPVLELPAVWREGSFWVGARAAAQVLGFEVEYSHAQKLARARHWDRQAQVQVGSSEAWVAPDGRLFVPARWLGKLGYQVQWLPEQEWALIVWPEGQGWFPLLGISQVRLVRSPRRIEVDLRRQRLWAYEGDVLIHEFRVSTGRRGKRTPSGQFQVRSKQKLHISRLYPQPEGGARMPWSLWFHEHYFIHGYHHVPRRPASMGCIRLRVSEASELWRWTPVGTPVKIYRSPKAGKATERLLTTQGQVRAGSPGDAGQREQER